jgi:hypothetical protein
MPRLVLIPFLFLAVGSTEHHLDLTAPDNPKFFPKAMPGYMVGGVADSHSTPAVEPPLPVQVELADVEDDTVVLRMRSFEKLVVPKSRNGEAAWSKRNHGRSSLSFGVEYSSDEKHWSPVQNYAFVYGANELKNSQLRMKPNDFLTVRLPAPPSENVQNPTHRRFRVTVWEIDETFMIRQISSATSKAYPIYRSAPPGSK